MGALAQVLRGMRFPSNQNLLVGTELFDDAGVYRLDASTALVLTVDFFPPLVDDPYSFGRIAAANALSDVYAMGGRPVAVLNIVGFPDDKLPIEVLADILRGGAERIEAAGAVVAGGHTVRDAEIKYGLAVTGIVHPDSIVTNAGAKPGDVLILTKPIGSGVLTTAAKRGRIDESQMHDAIEAMTELNAAACQAALEIGVHACTDITGFGLIGHVHEMASASKVTIKLNAPAVPLLPLTLELAREGIVTRAHKSNLQYVGENLRAVAADDTLVKVLADAQTSGGLLLSVAPDRASGLLEALRTRKTPCAARIGTVEGPSGGTVVLI